MIIIQINVNFPLYLKIYENKFDLSKVFLILNFVSIFISEKECH